MGDLSKNFSRHEFACPCGCGFDTVDTELLEALQSVANYYETTRGQRCQVIVTSGCRCPEHNATIPGAAADSQHIYGRAADIMVKVGDDYVPPKSVDHFFAQTWPTTSRGLYRNRNHIDTRTGTPRYWDQR